MKNTLLLLILIPLLISCSHQDNLVTSTQQLVEIPSKTKIIPSKQSAAPETSPIDIQEEPPDTSSPYPEENLGTSIYNPILLADLETSLTGEIWVHIRSPYGFQVIDLVTKTVRFVQNSPMDCSRYLLPNTKRQLCNFDEEIHIRDLETMETIPLSIPTPDWISYSPNGQFLLFGYLGAEEYVQTIEVFDLSKMLTIATIKDINYRNWAERQFSHSYIPALSFDGQFLAMIRYKESGHDLFAFDIQRLKYLDMAINNEIGQAYLNGIAWSPTSIRMVFGNSVTAPIDVGPWYLDEIHLFDLDPLSTTPLSSPQDIRPTDGLFYEFWNNRVWFPKIYNESVNWWEFDVWSGDGTEILMKFYRGEYSGGETQGICIIDIDNSYKDCIDILTSTGYDPQKYHLVGEHTWSPDNRFIVFIALYRDSVFIYDREKEEFILVWEDPNVVTVFWR